MKISIETCEVLGEKAQETEDGKYLASILQVHQFARRVGEGVTDLGSLMYPPLHDLAQLESQVKKQVQYIKELQDYILGLEDMPTKITGLADILTTAVDARQEEFNAAVASRSSGD